MNLESKLAFKNNQIFQLVFWTVARFLGLAFCFAVPYVIKGGKLSFLAYSFPTTFMYSLIGVIFLFSENRRPTDFSSETQMTQYRAQAFRIMWVVLLLITIGGSINLLRILNEGWEAIGNFISGYMSDMVLNALFFLAIMLTPTNSPSVSSSNATEKSFFGKHIEPVCRWTGYLTLTILAIFIVATIIERAFKKPIDPNANAAYFKSYELIQEEEEEAYIQKNCKSMSREEHQKRREEIEKEELARLTKGGSSESK